MIRVLFLTLIFGSTLYRCTEKVPTNGIPPCVQGKINEFEKNICKEGRVYSYTFRGEKVYVLDANTCCCDFTSDIYDNQCKLRCSLGGLIGNTKCEGIDFYSNASDKTLIWGKE